MISYRSDRVVKKGKIGEKRTGALVEKALAGESGQENKNGSTGDLEIVSFDPLKIPDLHWAIISTIKLEETITTKNEGDQEDFFAKYIRKYGYYDLFLIHPRGKVLYTVTREEDYGTNMVDGKYSESGLGRLVRQVLETNEFGIVDFEPYLPSNNEPAAFIAHPLIHNGRVQLIVALQLSLKAINSIMQQREGMGDSGETYLVGSDNLMRSDSHLDKTNRSVKASFANPTKGSVETEAVSESLAGNTDERIIKDYNGNPVLSAYTPLNIGDITWALIAEIDEGEVRKPVRELTGDILFMAGGIILLVGILAFFIAKGISDPLRKSVDFALSVAEGDLTTDIAVDRNDEIGMLINALREMKRKISDVLQETENQIQAVQEGRLDTRGDAEAYAGGWGRLISGLNRLIDVFVEPINMVSGNLERISEGDIPEKITDVYRGDFNRIGNNLNTLIDNINDFMKEIEKQIRAVQEGRLDARGNPDVFVGAWSELVVGINNLNDAFVAPINVAAGYIERISKGDIPEKIVDEYKGDFNTLKNNLNTLIDSTNEVTRLAEDMADGNLTAKVRERSDRDKLMRALNSMIKRLNKVMADVKTAAENVVAGSRQVSAGSEHMSHGTTEQAASAEETSASMEQMSSNISQNSDNAMQTERIALKSAEDAREGGKTVTETVTAMKKIAQKISIIEEIASQTDLLALNAAIEAARAGDYGKGFAVVASEVRKLAQRCQKAAAEINELSDTSVGIAENAGEMLARIVPDIQKTSELVQEISAASNEQNSAAEQINKSIQQLDQVIQQNVSISEEMASTAEELSGQAEQLQNTIEFFKIDDAATVKRRES
ncbi:methyl-accepting chemotaxis protein [Desulfobacterales bacterium HSG2]|nr:methyl-accepting chemotaxis protein [Desulfobacterales bacterium HSG2]